MASIIGIICALAILALATFLSTSSMGVFLNVPGLAIVIGGTFASAFISYPMGDVLKIFISFLSSFGNKAKKSSQDFDTFIDELADLARRAQGTGRFNLVKNIPGEAGAFLNKIVEMLSKGYATEEMREILDTELEQTFDEEMAKAAIPRTMAKLSPAYGIIGTLIGLIGMMQTMGGSLGELGQHMAVALTTTLYGILLANLFFLPMAVRMENILENRMAILRLIRDGGLMIRERASPLAIEEKLKAYKPQN